MAFPRTYYALDGPTRHDGLASRSLPASRARLSSHDRQTLTCQQSVLTHLLTLAGALGTPSRQRIGHGAAVVSTASPSVLRAPERLSPWRCGPQGSATQQQAEEVTRVAHDRWGELRTTWDKVLSAVTVLRLGLISRVRGLEETASAAASWCVNGPALRSLVLFQR